MKRRTALISGVAVLAALLPAGPAAAAAPAAPQLVGPADGATAVAPGSRLRVAVTDPDGGDLDVRFHGRRAGGTNPAQPFTFAVIPDTQNYASTAARRPIMAAQTQWLVDNRAALNLAFVSHLGDIVGTSTNHTQWQAASQTQATLDNAGVPNSILPGNHDMDVPTGNAPEYQQYFPPGRYSTASWNSASARYGGYLGQNLFGPDPVDRQNLDNFALVTAGGMDFVILNLEFAAPDYAIDWAKRVLAAYPQRRAILVTHSYVNTAGQIDTVLQRPGGNSPLQLWQKLVAPSCQIFLVVNGHFHDGDLSEARRTDTNSCGNPVHEILSDYQERVNGGNGWLRYYTFDPAADEIRARTYSPTLAAFETDADSQFTLPYDMATGPAPFTEIGRVSAASGTTAEITVPDLPPGTEYEWYATADDGTATATSSTWRFTTAPPPQPATLARDTFGRTASGGWGSAEVGGPWSMANAASRASVAGGVGVQGVPAGTTALATLNGVSSTATDLTTTFRLDAVPNGTVYLIAAGRRVGSAEYAGRVKVSASGAVEVHAMRGGTALAGGALTGQTLVAGETWRVRVQAEGTSPTAVRVKAWKSSQPEPAAWRATATDGTAGLQVPGSVGLSTYLSSSATNGPLTVRYDDLVATPTGTTPPPNTPPTAAFAVSTNDLAATVDGTTSSDADGTIAGHAWTFGDGGTATGATASHTYAAAGTYPVTLTVTDDDGATATTTRQVTVTATQPPTTLATDGFGRTVANGWGSAETGGTWTTAGTASRYAVTGGAGVHTVPSGVTTTATLAGVSSTATDLTARFRLDAVPNGTVYLVASGRRVGTAEYAGRVKVSPSGALEVHALRSGTALAGGAVPGLTLAAGEQWQVRVQVQGTSPATVRARVWKVGTTEPATWQATATDSTAGLQTAGGVGLATYLSSSATNGPLVVRYDDLAATRPA